ncbi:LamG domain-containing protein [Streptomyces sp. JJ36]|uniref:LamG domain-containing protein n=1 Tax=Streptomyces sp. JJ36 TaxID=2736645 RepID=UPI001F2C5593|nr:LamG domain-containing protein [Streptomyces sp. JJ36]MCF6524447.1 LamG domain-containing protein [Streptomyces sp. JJ36]
MNNSARRSGRGALRVATVIGALTALLTSGSVLPSSSDDTVLAGSAASAPQEASAVEYAPVQQTEGQAQAAAAANEEPVEVATLRQERRSVFANPDGSFTAYEYTNPVRAVRDGTWVPVDATLVQRPDGSWAPKAATIGLSFSDGGDGPFARMVRTGREYALTWLGDSLPSPTVQGDTATYPEVMSGVDLVVRAEPDGFAHMLVVKTEEAASNPALATIEYGVDTEGLTLEKTPEGGLRAEDAQVGGTVLEAGRAVMWDSAPARTGTSGTQARALIDAPQTRPAADTSQNLVLTDGPGPGSRQAPVQLDVGNGRLTLAPEPELLTGAETVYPVVIDPTPRTTSRSAWTSVMSASPNEQDWKYGGDAGVGKCPANYNPSGCADVGVRRLLFTMPTSFYDQKQIVKATFSARVAHVYWADATAEPIRLYRLGGAGYNVTSSSDWGNTSDDWNDHLTTVDRKIYPTGCSSQANLHFEGGELTSEIQAAADGGWSRISLGLRAGDESSYSGWKRVCGNAYLKVQYNTPPKQVDHRDMSSSPGGKCVWGSGRPYTNELPLLSAEARDPDHTSSRTDKVKMQFEVVWTAADGTERSYRESTSYKAPNEGTAFRVRMNDEVTDDLQDGSVIYWSARAYDGDSWGDWSWSGTPQRCEIVYDSTRPGAPAVTSEKYPDDEVWHHGVGTAGTFTFAPDPDDSLPDDDVVSYEYSFDGAPAKTATPASAGGTSSVTWTPASAGRHWVTVTSFDHAGNASVPAQYEFLVTEGRPVVGQWNLADPAGSDVAHDESLDYPATPGSGVEFGRTGPGGKIDSAVRLDGSANAYLDAEATVLDTRESFSVSAWARPTALDGDMAVVSQDGSGRPGFRLGYDATAEAWQFAMPDSDVTALGDWAATADVTVVLDQWVLLTGVYDAHATGGPEMKLYVNDQLQATAKRRSEWTSHGALQIGRAMAKSGYRGHFTGDLAGVRAFDRVLPQAQVAELMTVRPKRKGYWPLDDASSGSSANVESGGEPLSLQGDAAIYQPQDPLFDEPALSGTGHLALDGAGDWAATTSPPVTGESSFTVAARAKLTTLDPQASQTVLSLPGTLADRVDVRYQATTGQWELSVAQTDSADAEVTVVTDDQQLPVTGGFGQHLAVVYDAFGNELRLYVDGELTSTARAEDDTLWPATGGFQVGRSAASGGSAYFAGALDEVRVYAGAVDAVGVSRMFELTPDPDL